MGGETGAEVLEPVPQEAGDLHVLIWQVGKRLQRRSSSIVVDAVDLASLRGEFLIEDLAAGADGALEQVAGFLVEGHRWGGAEMRKS
jgi:hypothetical protein